MAATRKGGRKYQVQARKDEYKTASVTISSVSVARYWAKAVETNVG
ncbi:hypothetical protein N9444_10045 [Gammaproteobacteria bacterium]|jgi:hypothetical protein|nr:hypothetical protein [Gammaproteobacteria bacterium]